MGLDSAENIGTTHASVVTAATRQDSVFLDVNAKTKPPRCFWTESLLLYAIKNFAFAVLALQLGSAMLDELEHDLEILRCVLSISKHITLRFV